MSLVLSKIPDHYNLKWLWNGMKMNSSTGFQNYDSSMDVMLGYKKVKKKKDQKVYADETHQSLDLGIHSWDK